MHQSDIIQTSKSIKMHPQYSHETSQGNLLDNPIGLLDTLSERVLRV
jgi:hypothetical protein